MNTTASNHPQTTLLPLCVLCLNSVKSFPGSVTLKEQTCEGHDDADFDRYLPALAEAQDKRLG